MPDRFEDTANVMLERLERDFQGVQWEVARETAGPVDLVWVYGTIQLFYGLVSGSTMIPFSLLENSTDVQSLAFRLGEVVRGQLDRVILFDAVDAYIEEDKGMTTWN